MSAGTSVARDGRALVMKNAGLDHLLVRAGLRVPFRCRARLHLGAAFPLLGEERTDVIGELSFAHDW